MSVKFRPVTVERLSDELARTVAAMPQRWVRVAVDGVRHATDPAALADALVDPLRVLGRPVLRVSAWDFLRPASLRFERGKQDPDARYDDWLDAGALRREVLDPLTPTGTGLVLPSLWDTATDRATRRDRIEVPDRGVLILDGELLLGRDFDLDLSVHLWLSPAALRRRLPDGEHWAVPAYTRYEDEVRPAETADVVVRMDHPDRPAVRES
jgi:hypothetical protein